MRFRVVQYAINGLKIGEREYKTEAGAMKKAMFLRGCFPLAPIKVFGCPDNYLEEGFERVIPTGESNYV